MFGKDKVKGYSRVSKSKKGFKVIRVGDFFRKKDENRGKKIALGASLVVGAGIGSALLLKKKAIKFPGSVSQQEKIVEKALLTKKSASPIKVIEETVGIPPKQKTVSGENFVKQMDNEWGISKKKEFSRIEDPWETPILTKIQKESQLVAKKNEGSKLLTPAKPKERSLLQKPQRKTKNVEDRVIQVSNAQKDYKSLPVEMQTILQVEKALLSPTKASKLGRPPEKTSIVKLVDSSEGKLDKATRKVKDRLKREKAISDEAVKKN